MDYIPGDLCIVDGYRFGIPVKVNCIVMEVEDGRPIKLYAMEKEAWLLRNGFFEEGDEYVLWEWHFFLS